MNKYYRICKEYHGKEFKFIPNTHYEYLEETPSGEILNLERKNKINEVCFSKFIPNCFFAISMFIKENETYYIYETEQKPCLLAYKCKTGDFKATQEVRYRVPAKARYIGKFKIHSYFLEAIKSLYSKCNFGSGGFDSEHALDILSNHYNSMYNEIIYASQDIEKEFESMKMSEDDFKDFLEIKKFMTS